MDRIRLYHSPANRNEVARKKPASTCPPRPPRALTREQSDKRKGPQEMSDLPAQAGPARERRPVRDDDLGGSTRPQGRRRPHTPEAPTSGVRPVCECFDVAASTRRPGRRRVSSRRSSRAVGHRGEHGGCVIQSRSTAGYRPRTSKTRGVQGLRETTRAKQSVEPAGGMIVAEFFDVGASRSLPWKRRPEANRLLSLLADPLRNFSAVVVGAPASLLWQPVQSTFPVFVYYGVQLWVPEVGGPITRCPRRTTLL